MKRNLFFKDAPVHLAGRMIHIGMRAPDFKVAAADLADVGLSSFKGKTKVITTFLSLDTSVCENQVKEFNQRAAGMSDEVAVLAISQDLPFAQKRFCLANSINQIRVLSDYKRASFGINYGLLVREMNLLARSILIIDKNDTLRYVQIVNELTHQPDYDDAIRNLDQILRTPAPAAELEFPSHCQPCEKGTPPLDDWKVRQRMVQVRGWELTEGGKRIRKELRFKNFADATAFLELVSHIADEQNHHPVMTLSYGKLVVTLMTHAAGGLTDNDFILAKIINELEDESVIAEKMVVEHAAG